MRVKGVVFTGAAVLLGFLSSVAAASPTSVVVQGGQLLVGGKPFIVRGVGYSPVPICGDPSYADYLDSAHHQIYERDLPLLRQMGANTVRLWGWKNSASHVDFLDQAWNGGCHPIYVIVSFWMGPGNYANLCDSTTRSRAKADFRAMVAAVKNHPAVLMWCIGNELNASWMYGSQPCLFSLLNEMAPEARAEEGATRHPATTALADANLVATLTAYNPATSLDLWGVNVYRGDTFTNLFSTYQAASSRPLVILEYGIDAFDHAQAREYEDVQAGYAASLWSQIAANSAVCVGGSIMAYSDEWWKGSSGSEGGTCPEWDACSHSRCGYSTGSHPDGFSNEEWWGIVRPVRQGAGPDQVQPRAAYFALQSLWLDGDFGCDGKVDEADLSVFASCMTGPAVFYDPAHLPAGCTVEPDIRGLIPPDFDRDGDVDQGDFGAFQVKLTAS